jgi:hypothetical protein
MAAGNFLHHCVAVRYRVTGSGQFHSNLEGLDTVNGQLISPITLIGNSERYPNQLTNFIEQRMRVEFYVDAIDEYFTLRQISLYIKPVASGYPQ